jgi:membrane fusion protein, multidrug efflux system
MKPTLRWSLLAAAALSLATLLILSSFEARARSKDGPPPAPLTRVQLAPAQSVTTSPKEEVTGTLEPSKRVQLGFEVTGRLSRVAVKKGQSVKEGDLLAELATDLVDAQLQQAEASLAGAVAQAENARDVAARTEKLKAGGAVSEQQAKTVLTNARNADAQVALARAQVAEMRAKRIRQVLRAPFSGVVVDAPDQPGITVSTLVNTLFTLEQLDPLTVHLTVTETARTELVPGTKVHLSAVGSGASTEQATVTVVIPSADSATRRIPVELSVPNPDGRFTAHTLVRAQLSVGADQPGTQLPATALASVGGDHVWLVGADGALVRVPVQVVDRGATLVVVRAERPLARVVDSPAVDLAEGARVHVSSAPLPGASARSN